MKAERAGNAAESGVIDTAIVGAGPAGLSAALFLARAGRSVVAFDGGPSRIMAVNRVREYIGFDGMSPGEMLDRMRGEAVRYGVQIQTEKVQRIDPRPDGGFQVLSPSGSIIARSVVLATGLLDQLPNVKGLSKTWGNDLRVCPCFDGYEVRNKSFVVFGVPERVAHLGAWVSTWSPHVTVITGAHIDPAGLDRLNLLGIPVISDEVSAVIHRDGRLVAVTTISGKQIEADAVWVAMKWKATSDLAASLCDVDTDGLAKVDPNGKTSRPGVFAVGNAANPVGHLAHATAEGTNVGPHVPRSISRADVADFLPEAATSNTWIGKAMQLDG
jgi:thioredoxin reductase